MEPITTDPADASMLRLRRVARDNPDWQIGYDRQVSAWYACKASPEATEDHYRRDPDELLDLVEAIVAKEKEGAS
jgi:hypothetical protein